MKRINLKRLFILMTLFLLTASNAYAFQKLREEDENFFVSTDPKYEKLTERVRKASHNNSFNGSVLIATEDEIILYGGPKALTTAGLPVDRHTTYDIGSCSKLLTAVAVFQLIEKGQLSLSDPVTRFFPDYEAGREITVYHLLHMQSGIADEVNDPLGFWVNVSPEDMDSFLMRYFRDEVSDEEFLEGLYAAPLYFVPGSEESYCNTNYHLLAMIVEQISGMKFCDYLQQNIFDPCGLEHTSSMTAGNETSVPKMFGDLLEACIVDENGYSQSPNQERGAGGVHMCLSDLWTFDKALFAGQLVGEDALREMTHFDPDYGCGLMPYGRKAIGHSGRNATYTTQNIIIDSEQFGRVYVMMSTSTDAGCYGLDAIMKAVIAQLAAY